MNKHTVIVSIGSNHDANHNVDNATRQLAGHLDNMIESTAIETLPIGMHNKAMFVNKIVIGETTMSHNLAEKVLKQLETECGETRKGRKDGIVVIDIDILKYDDVRYHEADWDREYVARLLAEINSKMNANN